MKKLKQLLAAVLVLIIALNTPVCMETAAAKQTQMRRRIPRPVDSITIQEPSADSPENAESSSSPGSPEESENSSSVGSSQDFESSSEASSEAPSEEQSQTTSEEIPEEAVPENTTEGTPEDYTENEIESNTENDTENETESNSETETENETESNTENDTENDAGENTGDEHGDLTENSTEELPEDTTEPDTDAAEELQRPVQIIPEVTDAGVLDYRTYMEAKDLPKFSVRLEECTEDTELIEVSELQRADSEQAVLDEEMPEIHYFLKLEDDSVVAPHYFEEACVYDPDKACFKDAAALELLRVGETAYTVEMLGEHDREVYAGTGTIKVCNSPMQDGDFYIEVIRNGEKKSYTYKEWETYLKVHDNWVDGEVRPLLSETGNKFYTTIVSEETASTGKMKTYTFWAENPKRNASTKEAENGTRSYTVGMDKEPPVLTALKPDSPCFEPSKTDTVQYYAEDFVLTGAFEDTQSGLGRLEYTTQAAAGADARWTTVDAAADGTFRIVLSDGCYDAIAVRAYDLLGNVSKSYGFVNEQGEYIKVVVDSAAPVFKVEATAEGRPYCGDNDNWTNKDVDRKSVV